MNVPPAAMLLNSAGAVQQAAMQGRAALARRDRDVMFVP